MPDTLRRAARALVFLALAAAAGCGPRSVALYEKVMGSPSYRQVTESATRTREVHDGLDTRFILSATWLSGPWIVAFAEEYSNIYYLDAARREQVISRWRGESEKHVRFFVALYVPEEKGNDLEKPGTLWSLRLVRGDEVDFEPVYIRKASMRPEEINRFFPYSGTWYRAYEVAFPREAGEPAGTPRAGSPRLKLVLSGVEGRAVLAWQ
ncbi:MAG TPA: hypothetical protein VN450_08060 [Candidatus Methylomirabilis sp.]|nr:hypothetical protein [Candidatus Methylomirabilis sp.]